MRKDGLLVLDFDGTVANTMPQLAELAVSLVTETCPHFPKALVRAWYWQSIGWSIDHQLDQLMEPDDWRYWKILYGFERDRPPIYADAKLYADAVQLLQCHPQTTIISSTPHQLVWQLYSRFQRDRSPADITIGPKYPALRALRGKCLGPLTFVGDAAHDKEIAALLDIDFVGITRGWCHNAWPPGCKVIDSLTDLL